MGFGKKKSPYKSYKEFLERFPINHVRRSLRFGYSLDVDAVAYTPPRKFEEFFELLSDFQELIQVRMSDVKVFKSYNLFILAIWSHYEKIRKVIIRSFEDLSPNLGEVLVFILLCRYLNLELYSLKAIQQGYNEDDLFGELGIDTRRLIMELVGKSTIKDWEDRRQIVIKRLNGATWRELQKEYKNKWHKYKYTCMVLDDFMRFGNEIHPFLLLLQPDKEKWGKVREKVLKEEEVKYEDLF